MNKEDIVKQLLDSDKNNLEDDINEVGIYILEAFFKYRDLSHLWHFQTDIEAVHTTLNEFYDLYLDKMDKLVECYIGAYGKIKGAVEVGEVKGMNTEADVKTVMDELYTVIFKLTTNVKIKSRPDLLDQVHKILKLISQTNYKLNLR